MQIKLLAREGVPKSRIAERLGISRQTVYNHLNRTGPFPKKRAKRGSKLDPFKSYIRGRLEAFDLPATVLLTEIRERGYAGGITILREFVRPLKEKMIQRVTERFETVPGQQAQIDWGECGRITVDGERRKLYLFVFVLGYSRMMYAHFTTSTRIPTLLTCLQTAFRTLGAPRELLVDNMKQAVEHHDVRTRTVRWNKRFLDFLEHYGTAPLASPPYWPRVKGKVERGVGYVKRSFLEGRSFTSLEDLNHQLEHWLATVANVRVHGTTRERPTDRYVHEQAALQAARAVPIVDTRPIEHRQVPSDSHISFRGTRYSVHPKAVGRTVVVRLDGDDVGATFSVHLGEECIARHRLRPKGSPRVTLVSHGEAIRAVRRASGTPRRRPNGAAPAFDQRPHELDHSATDQLERYRQMAPTVETRTLALYEDVAEAENGRARAREAVGT